MSFLLTIYDEDRNLSAGRDEAAAKELVDAYWALDAEAKEKGVYIESVGLHPAATAKTLRLRDGEESVTDGPFAETKEQLGGFYLLDCDTMDEALAWAAKIPAARTGSVEVREVMDYEAAGFEDPTREAARST
jgi:hypothetical protein